MRFFNPFFHGKILRMRKIFWAIPDLEIGGAERMTVDIIPEFADHGDEVTLFLVRKRGAFLEKIPSSVRVRSAEADSLRTAIRPLARALREEKPDVIISNLTHLNLAVIFLARLMGLKSKILVFEHNTPSIANRQSFKETVILRIAGWVYRLADRVLAVSVGSRADVLHSMMLPEASVSIVYNPINISEIRTEGESLTGIEMIDQSERPLILAVGRLEPQKNFAFLLRAFALLLRRHPARLVLLGEGSERAMLTELAAALGIETDVLMPGVTRNPYAFIARADVVACSSLYEGFNRTIAEALALGKRVVSVDCPWGPAEILRDGEFGTLTKMGDEAAFADALLTALTTAMTDSERRRNEKRGEDFSAARSYEALDRAIREA